jgi:hypothetical protein
MKHESANGAHNGIVDLAFSIECVPRVQLSADDARQLAAESALELDDERGVVGLYEWLQQTDSSSLSAATTVKLEPSDAADNKAERVLDAARAHLDKEVAFVLHLRPHHFSINNQTTQHVYTHATNALLEAIDAGRLPPDVQDMLEDIPCPFYDGGVVVELCDYRGLAPADVQQVSFNGEGVTPRVRRVLLKPDNESIVDDVNRLWNGHKVAYPQWGPEQYVAIEQRLVHAIAPPLCLNPSPLVGRALAVLHYNRLKMNYRAPDQLRPAIAERSTRRSLSYFLLARNAITRVPPAGQLSLPAPVPGSLPVAKLTPTPTALAAEAHARIIAQLSRSVADSLAPNVAPPPTLALVTNKRQLKLQGDASAMYLKAVENPLGSYEGLIRITDARRAPRPSRRNRALFARLAGRGGGVHQPGAHALQAPRGLHGRARLVHAATGVCCCAIVNSSNCCSSSATGAAASHTTAAATTSSNNLSHAPNGAAEDMQVDAR